MFDNFIVWSTALLDPVATFIIILILVKNKAYHIAPTWHRLGLSVVAIGMMGQAYRSWYTILTGISPTNTEMPYWLGKDFGITILSMYTLYVGITKYNESREG